jgi:pilus assembly protein FimV
MKSRWYLSFCLLGMVNASAYALGLGEIKVQSALNDPLNATIELTGTIDATEEQLLANLGSKEDFDRLGISRDGVLLQIKFAPQLKEKPPVIHVTSDIPVREPVLNFVLDVQSPKAQVMREYTVFLNPAK